MTKYHSKYQKKVAWHLNNPKLWNAKRGTIPGQITGVESHTVNAWDPIFWCVNCSHKHGVEYDLVCKACLKTKNMMNKPLHFKVKVMLCNPAKLDELNKKLGEKDV